MLPTIGRIVIYNTTEEDRQKMIKTKNCNVQEKLPAIVVATFEKAINLKVFVDGELDLWKYGILQGINHGEWDWPIIQK